MEGELLIIAPRVPQCDQNSGDLRLFSMLDILSKYYKITFFANQRGDRGEFTGRYITRVRELGVNVPGENWSIWKVLRKEKYKAAIVEFYDLAENYLPRIKIMQPSCRIVIDSVDLNYYRLYLKYEVTRDKSDLQKAEETKKRELAIYRKAELVIAVTEEDARILRKDCPGLTLGIVPNIHRLVSPGNNAPKNELIFVGGFNHDPNVDAVLYFCRDILPLIREKVPEVKLTVVGANPPEEIKKLINDLILVTGYVPSVTSYLRKSYISVAPLRYGAGMKGKIGEAMAHGVPVVTTSVGAQGMGLLDRENTLIADNPESFAMAVVELMKNDILYRMVQKNAIEHVKNNYTAVQVSRQIQNILAELDDLPIRKMSLAEKGTFIYQYGLEKVRRKFQRGVPS